MDQFHQVNHSSALNPPKDGLPSTQSSNDALRQMGSEGKMGAVHEEMKRVSRLPPSSAYATHRMRVLNKILQLLSIQALLLLLEKNGSVEILTTHNLEPLHRMRSWNCCFLVSLLDDKKQKSYFQRLVYQIMQWIIYVAHFVLVFSCIFANLFFLMLR